MNFDIEFEQEEDGRWIAEIPEIPGVLAYGVTPLQAGAKVKALALRVLAERMENEVSIPGINSIEFANHYGRRKDSSYQICLVSLYDMVHKM